jgi:hypothetical protein
MYICDANYTVLVLVRNPICYKDARTVFSGNSIQLHIEILRVIISALDSNRRRLLYYCRRPGNNTQAV